MNYLVTWTIDIEAENAEQAALIAKQIQRDKESTANYFEVKQEQHEPIFIDLDE